jgi:alpha-aminoadipic semialdehyde synthase
MLVNGIYWEPRYPRIVTKRAIKNLFAKERKPRLRVIGDITCDIDGSVQLTVKETNQENPVYVFEAATGKIKDGVRGRGPVVLSVDKLPTELPFEASLTFGGALLPFVPALARMDYSRPVRMDALPPEFRNALIVRHGALTKPFHYLKKHLSP